VTVLVGFIRTPEGRAALARGVEEARLRRLPLVVIHIDSPEPSGKQRLDDLRAELDAADVEYRLQSAYRGLEPAEDLVQSAEAEDAQLIVIGLRKRSAVGKFLLGSNAQRVLLDAACPVLAVKAP
jgi:nucleotide-binding universal stress UspA family protein